MKCSTNFLSRCNDQPSIIFKKLTIRVQHSRNVQILFGDVEGSVEVFERIVLGQLIVINEIGAMAMDEGAECQTVLEGEMEVLYVDVLVWRRFALAPQQQTLLGCHLFHRDVLDGETKNDRPDHSEGHFQVSVDDF